MQGRSEKVNHLNTRQNYLNQANMKNN